MSIPWTEDQIKAINHRGSSAIVSAGAGSGKTKVMVERIVSILCDENNRIPADSILAVTFTNAAAGELKSRIRRRMMELISEQPENEYIKTQLSLIRRAFIGTIDSYCVNLVRSHFSSLDLQPDFTVIDEGSAFSLEEASIRQTMETMYAEEMSGMEELSDFFGKSRTDRDTADIIKSLYNFEKKLTDHKKWESKCLTDAFSGSVQAIRQAAGELISEALEAISRAADIIEECDEVKDKYEDLFISELYFAQELYSLWSVGNYTECRKKMTDYTPGRLPSYRGSRKDISEAAKSYRNQFKEIMTGSLTNGPWLWSDEEITAGNGMIVRPLSTLFKAVNLFRDNLWNMKQSRRELGFDDIERLALELLRDEQGNATDVARSEADKYSYILIDEYQDTNALQDSIFTLISRRGSNLFYVGDVKQSIYAFRNAEPGFFMEKTALADKDPDMLSKITLNRNFRSGSAVIDSINSIFMPVMSKHCGGVDYTKEPLVFGSEKSVIEHRSELCIIPGHGRQSEADYVAARIHEMISSGFTIRDEKGGTRPCRPGDFAIIMRSPASGAASMIEALSDAGIPVSGTSRDNLFSCSEVSTLVSVMSAANNPRRDIDVAAAAMSPLFSISADTLAKSKIHGKTGWLFADLEKCDDYAAQHFVQTIKELGILGARKPVGVFARLISDSLNAELLLCAGENMQTRIANIRTFLQYASTYDSKGTSLSEFCAICRDMRSSGRIKCAPISGGSNTVTVTSVHGSKGLEWPIVFVTGCEKTFNNRDSSVPPVLFFRDHFPGARVRVSDNNNPYYLKKLPSYHLVSRLIKENNTGEEMRLFYVALTRAKDKLIMTGCKTDPLGTVLDNASIYSRKISKYDVKGKTNWLDWALMALSSEGIDISSDDTGIIRAHSCDIIIAKLPEITKEEEIKQESLPDPEGIRILNEISDFPGYDVSDIPLRVSVTDLVHDKSAKHVDRPSFALKRVTAEKAGTVMHSFMQYADYRKAASDPESEIERLIRSEFITPENAMLLDPEKIRVLFSTDIGSEMIDHFDELKREYRFFDTLDAKYVNPTAAPGTMVLLQGVADCVIPTKNGIILVDYKTDKVSDIGILAERYGNQIVLYRKALEKQFGQKIIKAVIYSFSLGKSIEIQ